MEMKVIVLYIVYIVHVHVHVHVSHKESGVVPHFFSWVPGNHTITAAGYPFLKLAVDAHYCTALPSINLYSATP